MPDITFVDRITPVTSAWLNEVNRFVHDTTAETIPFNPAITHTAGSIAEAVATLQDAAATSVEDFGAVGDGTTDDTAAFLASANALGCVNTTKGKTYRLNGLNVDFNVKLLGSGTIKTSNNVLLPLNTIDRTPSAELRVMFMEGNKPSVEELLHIKSLGYTAVMAYPWHLSLDVLIRNAECVGLNLIVHSANGTTSVPATITPNTGYDARASVIGYYLLDEPAGNAISVVDQDRIITAYRAVTNKPLYCAEFVVMFGTQLISANWDVIFNDQYYANSHASGNEAITSSVRNHVEFTNFAPKAKIIPCLGLFRDTGFTLAASVVSKLTIDLLKFSKDGSFGVFVWDAGVVADTYQGVRNNGTYHTTAAELVKISKSMKPYNIQPIAIGDLFGGNNKLHSVWKTAATNAQQDALTVAQLIPWEIINVGAATDVRRQAYADSGLMPVATGGAIGFAGMPSGRAVGFLQYANQANAATCTVTFGSSKTGAYTTVDVGTPTVIANNAAAGFTAVTSSDTRAMPTLKATLSINTLAPSAMLRGYLAFTDIPTVSY